MMANQIAKPAMKPARGPLKARAQSIAALMALPAHSAMGAMTNMPTSPASRPPTPPAAMLVVVPGTRWLKQKLLM